MLIRILHESIYLSTLGHLDKMKVMRMIDLMLVKREMLHYAKNVRTVKGM